MPVACGSVTQSTALAAMAASMALPPACNTARPACVAIGWLAAIMPCVLMTTERPGYWLSRIFSSSETRFYGFAVTIQISSSENKIASGETRRQKVAYVTRSAAIVDRHDNTAEEALCTGFVLTAPDKIGRASWRERGE